MTTSADNTIDELIKRVKAMRSMSGFAFVSEYPPRETPYPIDRYAVTAVSTGMRIKRRFVGDRVAPDRKGTLYRTVLRLRVYAPQNSSGAALLRATALLCDAVESADSERMVQDVAFSDISYDTTARTIRRDLNVTLFLLLSEEVRDD